MYGVMGLHSSGRLIGSSSRRRTGPPGMDTCSRQVERGARAVSPSGAMDFVIGLDVGTAGSRAVAVTAHGRVLAVAAAAHPAQLTGPGRIEQDPADWWRSAARCLRSVTGQAG